MPVNPVVPLIVSAGDNVVDCYPDLGVMYPGGNAVNVAVHARRCGGNAAYLGVIGSDEAGRLVRQSLVDEQVDTTRLRTELGPTAHAVVRLVGGNRMFESGDVGVSRFRLDAGDFAAVAAADVVHTGECSMLEQDVERMAAVSKRLSFDFSERQWDYVRTYAPYADIAVLSAIDGSADAEDIANEVADLGPAVVAVTRGAAGAVLRIGDRILTAPAGSGEIVDTLGAGDAFIARLLVGLARAEDPEVLLPAATQYATETCASYGAFGYRAALSVPPVTTEGAAIRP